MKDLPFHNFRPVLSTGWILLAAFSLHGGEGGVRSDLDVLHAAVEREVEAELPWELVPDRVHLVEDGPTHPHGWVLRDGLAALLIAKGHQVVEGELESPAGEMRYRIGRLFLEHRKVDRFFGFSSVVERDMELEFTLSLRSEGRLLWLRRLDATYADRISLSLRERARIPGLTPELTNASGDGFGRALLATAVVGGIIYLLYTGGK
jgi:hypothetical protein